MTTTMIQQWTGWSVLPNGGLTKKGLAATQFGSNLYVFHTGLSNQILMSVFDGKSWTAWDEVPMVGGRTDDVITAGVYGSLLYLMVKGNGTNDMWYNAFNGRDWTGWSTTPNGGLTLSGPTLVPFGPRLFALCRGMENGIWYSSLTGPTWSQWAVVPPTQGRTDSSIAAAPYGSKLYLMVNGDGTDDQIWVNPFDGNMGGQWSVIPVGGKTRKAPALTVYGSNLYAFHTGLSNQIFMSIFDGQNWTAWNEVPTTGRTDEAVAATFYGSQLYLFVKGMDEQIWLNVMTPR